MEEIIKHLADSLDHPQEILLAGRQFIEERFGTPGLIAAALLIVSIAGLMLAKMVRLAFDILKYVVVPAAGTVFIGSFFMHNSLVYLLPLAVAFFSVVLVIRS
jgi:hypothetical protein